MIEKTVCFTGHRNIPVQKRKAVVQRLKTELSALINNGYQFFMAGGALGFDTIAALTVLDLKIEYSHIKLILVLPCPNQTRGWNETDKQTYEYIKSRADNPEYLQFYCGIHPRGFGRRCLEIDRCILSGRGGCRPRTLLTIRFRPSWCRTEP